jgi:hypothetical protein
MIVLFALKIFIAVWKWALRTSRRFSLRTLRVITACSVALFLLSYWGWHEVRRADERHQMVREQWVNLGGLDELERLALLEIFATSSLGARSSAHSIANIEFSAACYIHISSHMSFSPELYALRQQTFDPLDLGRHFRREVTNFVQVSAPERTDFKHTILFWLSLIGMVVSPISTVVTLLFAWITLHRKRAEELLMRLELEKRRLEIEQLRLDLERARREHEESNAASPKIVLLS